MSHLIFHRKGKITALTSARVFWNSTSVSFPPILTNRYFEMKRKYIFLMLFLQKSESLYAFHRFIFTTFVCLCYRNPVIIVKSNEIVNNKTDDDFDSDKGNLSESHWYNFSQKKHILEFSMKRWSKFIQFNVRTYNYWLVITWNFERYIKVWYATYAYTYVFVLFIVGRNWRK